MAPLTLLVILLGLAVIGFIAGRKRALHLAGGKARALHSLPVHYGTEVALFALVPALGVLIVWMIAAPLMINHAVSLDFPDELRQDSGKMSLVISDMRRVAAGLRQGAGSISSQSQNPELLLAAAQHYNTLSAASGLWRTIAALLAAIAGLALSLARIHPRARARNVVEGFVKAFLIGAASVAILTTGAIVASMLSGTISFFGLYPAAEFFLGTTWSPRFGGGSSLGILPLLWGTLYISAIALAVAVPIGLFAAIYLSEYAPPRARGILKPLLELLAGIPTIVYGLFALVTVGPGLARVFGAEGLGWMAGSSAVMTAGLVMGVMLVPFVSSLSDDILNAVPQAMRDGSLGLGATRSETLRLVVLPAALPGIVGAVLLAASRAIGETMIVVMGAGSAARLSLNPFEAMTTVTAKIVSQLTGDADFASAEALVAFALGMTLFVLTLGLNVVALTIVRKYREQYE